MNNTSAANISEDHRSGISMKVPSKAEGIVSCSVHILASAFIVVGNLLTIVLFAVDKRLHKKSFFLVISMAFADLLLGAVSMPFYIYMVLGIQLYQLWTGSMNMPLWYLFSIADNFATVASLLSATFISCERFYAIYRPFKHRTLTVRTYRIIIFTLWTLAALHTGLAFLPDLGKLYYRIWLSLGLMSMIIICGCNIAIWRKFQHGSLAASSQQQNRDLQNKRLTKTLGLVSFLALFCWLPYVIVFSVIYSLNQDVVIPWRYLVIISFVNYSNAIVNPVVYAFRIREFRQALALCCSLRRRAAAVNTENLERRNNKAAVLTTPTQLRTLQGYQTVVNQEKRTINAN